MSVEEELGSSLTQLIQNMVRPAITTEGIVKDVDESNYTCTVTVGGETDFLKVPLRVLIGSAASIVEIPVVGTNCLLCFRDNNINRPQIFGVDRASRVQVDATMVRFNGGLKGGLVVVGDLVTRLNLIENAWNALNTKVNVLAPTPVLPPLVPTTVVMIQNNSITQ